MPPREPPRHGPGGLVGIYALHLMTRGPIYGWQVAERIAAVTHDGWRPGAGAIYPILKGLVARGYARTEVRGGKKLYRVTPKGRTRVALAKTRMRDGAGRWVNLRFLVLDMVDPGERDDWLLARLASSVHAFTELVHSEETFPRAEERTRLGRAGARELRRALTELEAGPTAGHRRPVRRSG